jgi:hypothetical protein
MLSMRLRRAGFTTLVAVGLFFATWLPVAQAQRPGVAASVTSHGFGGHTGMAPGVPASVTAHGTFAPNRAGYPIFRPRPLPGREFHHPRRGYYPGAVVYSVPYYPYAYDLDEYGEVPYQEANPDQYNVPYNEQYDGEYSGGPTIFDRRGPGPGPAPEARPSESPETVTPAAETQPEPAEPSTVLIFKDGHQLEIANYAIVGDTLFDLTPGHPRRVALSDLDLHATQKQNDDRGSDFRLPSTPQGS